MQYRKARGCSQRTLQVCRGLFVGLNAGIYVVYVAVEMLKITISSANLYMYDLGRANTILTSFLLVISVLQVFVSGFAAIRVISVLLPQRIHKVTPTPRFP